MTDSQAMMSILGHLDELRRRLIQVVIAVLGAAVIGFIFSGSVLDLLRAPLPDAYENLYFTNPADAFSAQLKIAGFLGIALAMPVILFHVWRFVTPGLTARERRFVWPVMLAALALFALGVAVGFAVIPYALNFLLGFARPGLEPLLTVDGYIGFVTTMLLAFGLVLEFPVVLVGLARVGVLNHRRLAAQRRWAILAIVLFAIVLTPGGDPISPLILSGVMFLLFEGSLLVIRLIRR
ncbi:MAG: twin-arginine translocase subunit TatC [Candidatus Limnocylindria bacterium]